MDSNLYALIKELPDIVTGILVTVIVLYYLTHPHNF
jgi:hypothetical protein